MNTTPATPAPQLRDVRVRQAISYAIDRAAIAKFLVGESAQVLDVECHRLQFGCNDANVPRYAYDPKRARELLAEAGYPKGFDVDIYAYLDRNRAEAIINYLRAVGIRARLRWVEAAAAATARRSGRTPLMDGAWNARSIFDVSNSTSRNFAFTNDDINRDPEVRDLLLRGDAAMDPEARKDAYGKALKLIAERAYSLPLYSIPNYHVAAKDLVFGVYTDEKPRFWEMYWK